MLHNKYYAIKILILICCINMDAMNQNVDTNTNNGVIIFSENNYQGTNTILKPGNYLISELQNIKSITIPNGLEVFLSNKDDFDDESAEKISCPSVDELKNNNSTEEYKLDNIDTSKYKYLYVLKVDLNNEDGIASHDEYDSNTGKYFGRHVSKVKEFSSTEKENLKEIVIDSSPDFQGLPDLTQYKNLQNIKLLFNVLKGKSEDFIKQEFSKIINYIDKVNPLKIIEIQGELPSYHTTQNNKFFGFNLTELPTINNNIQEIHLINCKELSSIDFSKYTSVKKICMYGNTLEKSTEAQWKTMIEQLYTLSTNITKQEQQKIAFFAIPKTITVSASLKHIQLPRTYTGEIPKNSNSSQSQIQYLSALGATSVAQDAFKDQQALTELYLPNVREVKSNAFYHCFKIEKVSLDKCEVLEEGAFRTNRALQSMYLPLVKKLGKLSIAYTRSNKLKIGDLNNQEFKSQSEAGLYLPFCEEIGDGACRGDNEDKVQIVNVNCPVCKTLGVEAFRQLTALKIVNIPEVETIGQSAFEDCSLLTKVGDINDISNNSIYLPKVKSIANYAFKNGDKGQNIIIQSIILPECERIGREAFMRYRTMKTLSIPKCKSIGILSFYDPYKLQELEATELETIGANAFQYASVPIRSFKTVNGNKKIDNGYLELPNCKKIETKAFWGSGAHSIRGTNVVKLPKCESAADDSFRAAYLTTLDASKLSNRAKILSTSKSG